MRAEVQIDRLSNGPAGVGRLPDGKTVFVDGAAPGDVVRVEVTEDRERFAAARLVEVLQPGDARVAPPCPLAGRCGGCPWMHVAYEAQLSAKRDAVEQALVRIAKLDPERARSLVAPCAPSKRQLGYRNKLELAASRDAAGRLVLGLHEPGAGEVVPVGACPLAHKGADTAPKALQGALRFLEGDADLGIFRVGVRRSVRTQATEVALWTAPGPFPRAAAARTLASAVRATGIVRVLADPGRARKVKGTEVLSGQPRWREQLGGFEYEASAPSFFQVNTAQAERLVELVCEGLDLSEDDRVADLYCGVGTFTLPLAERAGEVLAVESAGSSVRDLRRNVDAAGAWVDVLGGDSARELPEMGRLDALVVDPPRAGLADGMAESIAAAAPARLAYVSCDAATWARDAARLEARGFELARAVPVDLFPQTPHVEVVSIFRARP